MKHILTALLSLAVGFGGGFLYGTSLPAGNIEAPETIVSEDTSVKPLPESIVSMGQGQEVKQLVGKVQSVSGNTITFAPESLYDPTLDPSLSVRTVTISPETKITKLVPRDPKLIETELEEAKRVADEAKRLQEEAVAAGAKPALTEEETTPNAPAAFESVDGNIGDIREGERVSITTDIDVRTAGTFTASWIQILPAPPVIDSN